MSRKPRTLLSSRVGPVLCVGLLVLACSLGTALAVDDAPVPVRHIGGSLHGFLVLKDEHGQPLADGELVQFLIGSGNLKSILTFNFHDGSQRQEITIFSQRRNFRLLSDHLVQKGPAFKQPMDLFVNAQTGDVTARYTEKDGLERVSTEHMHLPPNLANGLVSTMLENLKSSEGEMTLAMVVAAPKPRLVRLQIRSEGDDSFSVGGTTCKARRFLGKVDIGGVAGAVAGLVGKQPPDSHFWIIQGVAPTFLKSISPESQDGPLWEIDFVAPNGPKENSSADEKK